MNFKQYISDLRLRIALRKAGDGGDQYYRIFNFNLYYIDISKRLSKRQRHTPSCLDIVSYVRKNDYFQKWLKRCTQKEKKK